MNTHLRWSGLSLATVVFGLLWTSSAAANETQYGASGLHAKESSKPATEDAVPAATAVEFQGPAGEVGEVAGFSKGNLNPFFIQMKGSPLQSECHGSCIIEM